MSLYLGDKKIAGAGGGGNANVVSCADYEEYLAVRGSYPEQTTFYTPDGPGGAGGCRAGELSGMIQEGLSGISRLGTDHVEQTDILRRIETIVGDYVGNANCLDWSSFLAFNHGCSCDQLPYDCRVSVPSALNGTFNIDGKSVKDSIVAVAERYDGRYLVDVPCQAKMECHMDGAFVVPFRYGKRLGSSAAMRSYATLSDLWQSVNVRHDAPGIADDSLSAFFAGSDYALDHGTSIDISEMTPVADPAELNADHYVWAFAFRSDETRRQSIVEVKYQNNSRTIQIPDSPATPLIVTQTNFYTLQ